MTRGALLAILLVSGAAALLGACAMPKAAATPAPAATCRDESGNLVQAGTLVQSSGSARLNQGTTSLMEAAAAQSATRGGEPVPRCVTIRVRFTIPAGQPPPRPITLRVCVDADANLTSAPQLVDSSGYPGIDQIALGQSRAGSYKEALQGRARRRASTINSP
jgi:outer membrane biosynthesis protein TonB